jgi:hypothetical protein
MVVDLSQLEEAAMRFHESEARDAASVWADGINIMLRALEIFDGHRISGPEQGAILPLFTVAAQSLRCSYLAASRGYFPQSLNLQRVPVENALAAGYLMVAPQNWGRFVLKGEKPPKNRIMFAQTKKVLGSDFNNAVASAIRQLDAFSHVDRIGSQMVTTVRGGEFYLGADPQQSVRWFSICTHSAGSVLALLMAVLSRFRMELGYSNIVEGLNWATRAETWRQESSGDRAGPEPPE